MFYLSISPHRLSYFEASRLSFRFVFGVFVGKIAVIYLILIDLMEYENARSPKIANVNSAYADPQQLKSLHHRDRLNHATK